MINPSANASHPSPKRCVHALVATGKGFSWLAWFPKVVIYSFFCFFSHSFTTPFFTTTKNLEHFLFPSQNLEQNRLNLLFVAGLPLASARKIPSIASSLSLKMFPVSSPAPMTAESNSGSVNGTHFWGDETWCISRVILREFPQASALLGLVIFWPPDKELEDFFWKSPKKAYKVLLWLCQAVGFV